MSELVLETERLGLYSWDSNHLGDLLALHGDSSVARYFTAEGLPWSEEKCRQRLAIWAAEFETQRMGKLRLIRKSDGVLVGRAGFGLHAPTGEPEIGYALYPRYWGNGYALEAAAGLRDWIFRETDWDHFIGFAHQDNTASLKVLEKIGMQPTHKQIIFEMPCQFYIHNRPKAHD